MGILVGTKADLRNDAETQAQLRAKNLQPVAIGEIEQMVNEVNAVKYIECSALTQEGLKNVFDEAIRAALYKPNSKKKKNAPSCKLWRGRLLSILILNFMVLRLT